MSSVYLNQSSFSSLFSKFIKKVFPKVRKTQLNILPYIVYGMILSESSVASDIAKILKLEFSLIQFDSVVKRIRRFYNNPLFKPYSFYDSIIRHVISNYKKKHLDRNVHIIFDHMFSHDNYSVFMISLRVGKQGIPLWFRTFKGIHSDAFQESVILEGIQYVTNLFGNSYHLIFLADRWFDSIRIMDFIHRSGHIYCIRLKRNRKVLVFDKKENHYIWKDVNSLFHFQHHSSYITNVFLTEEKYPCTLVLGQKKGFDDPWIIVTNGNPSQALRHYSYRFGGIESLFKNQKSNGFRIESVSNASLTSFTTMYTLVCTSILFLTILGCDYTKNKRCYKNVKIETHKNYKNKGKVRIMSLFKVGLTLFKLAIDSYRHIRISFRFILYDI